MNFVLKNGSGHYYTTAREFYGQQEWARISEAARKGYQKASAGFDPNNYAPVQPLEKTLSAADAIDDAIAATAEAEIAKAQLTEPTP